MPMKAIVFGAGISGLSSAHELAEQGYKVIVYERLNVAGGVARSERREDGVPSEYSWRGYGPHYDCAFEYMKNIPISDNMTVFDNLSKPVTFTFTNGTLFNAMSLRSKIVFYMAFFKSLFSCKERQEYDATVNCAEYFRTKMDENSWKHFIATIGPWVGIDPLRASLHHVMSFFYKLYFLGGHEHKGWKHKPSNGWLVFNQPTNEAWFDPWVNHLKEKYQVSFEFEKELYVLEKFYKSEQDDEVNKLLTVKVKDLKNRILQEVSADVFVFAISPFQYVDIIERCSEKIQKFMPNLQPLIQDGPHIQIAFSIGFKNKITWSGTRHAYIIDTLPFNITLYRQDEFWDNISLGDLGLQSLWSGTVCVSYKKGILYDKPATELTKKEFEEEVIAQIRSCKGLMDKLSTPGKLEYDYFNIWYDWNFNGSGVSTKEPKFVDSTNTRVYQPNSLTGFENVLLVGAHTKTSMDLWSMEAAAESGMNAIREYEKRKYPYDKYLSVYEREEHWILLPIRILDYILYNLPVFLNFMFKKVVKK